MTTHLAAMCTAAHAAWPILAAIAAAVALGLYAERVVRRYEDRADERDGRALVERGEQARARGRAG